MNYITISIKRSFIKWFIKTKFNHIKMNENQKNLLVISVV
ncbi:MAG: hypothetical protein OFPI_00460 [Osedax symbiont Rs2]|nr:MAG: hypothetical protein OFPI_00460 [Osedax symbiont Rs2]